jgi:hypothetical protein
MSAYDEIKATIESPGMGYILRALRAEHKRLWREYRACRTEVDLAKVQTAQLMIDRTLPGILEGLMNAHIPKDRRDIAKKRGEWWSWLPWYEKHIKPRLYKNS